MPQSRRASTDGQMRERSGQISVLMLAQVPPTGVFIDQPPQPLTADRQHRRRSRTPPLRSAAGQVPAPRNRDLCATGSTVRLSASPGRLALTAANPHAQRHERTPTYLWCPRAAWAIGWS
jgi:hypothetical protein